MTNEAQKPKIDKAIDFIFSKSTLKWLILIMILALALRFLLVNDVGFLGDEMVHGPHSIGILKTGILSRMTQSPVWFYLTDIFYKIFNVTAFSSRFLSFLFGILAIPLVFLLGKKLYDKKTGLAAAFLFAISAFTIRFSLIEMDIAAVFFVLLSLIFLIKGHEKGKLSYLSIFFLGIGVMMKSSAYFFIPGFLIWFYWNQEKPKEYFLKNYKKLIVFVFIAILMLAPIITYNYLLYKDKGIVDVYVSKFFNINRAAYAYQSGIDKTFSFNDLITGGFGMFKSIVLKMDPFIMILGIIGFLLLLMQKDRKFKSILPLSVIIPFIILASSVLLHTHFVIIMPFMCILAAFAIKKITKDFTNKKIFYALLIIALIVSLYLIYPYLTSQAAIIKTRNFAKEIPSNALVIVDGRFYTGRTAWMFFDKQYLSSSYIPEAFNLLQNFTSKEIPIETYYIECASDDCGWGTVASQPEFNQSMEQIGSMIKQSMTQLKSFNGGGGYDEPQGQPTIQIYKATLMIKPEIFQFAKSTRFWWGYSVNYEADSYDTYKIHTTLDYFISFLAHIVLWVEIIFAIISIVIPFYFLYKEIKNEAFTGNSTNNT